MMGLIVDVKIAGLYQKNVNGFEISPNVCSKSKTFNWMHKTVANSEELLYFHFQKHSMHPTYNTKRKRYANL